MRIVIALMAILAALFVVGCGGTGSGSSGRANNVDFFATDDLNSGYDGVWVTVFRIELLTSNSAKVVFDDPDGRVVNVRSLNNSGAQLFAYMGGNNVTAGTFTGMRVTLGKDVALFTRGGSIAQMRTFVGLNAQDRKAISATFGAPRDIGGGQANIVVDFKLSDWVDDGTNIQNAVIVEGSETTLQNPDAHVSFEIRGIATAVQGSGSNTSFRLNTLSNMHVAVQLDENTAVVNADGAPNPQIKSGDAVEVNGKWSPVARDFVATSVMIAGRGAAALNKLTVRGNVVSVDSGAQTFNVSVAETMRFMPARSEVTVQVDERTTILMDRGGARITLNQFFEMISARLGFEVVAKGILNSSGVLVAQRVIVIDRNAPGHAEISGTLSSWSEASGTMVVNVQHWEGINGQAGMSLNVQTSGSTQFRTSTGESVAAASFFSSLSAGMPIEIKGNLQGEMFVATIVRLEEAGLQEAEGVAINIVPGTGWELVVTDWNGFSSSFGTVIHAVVQSGTEFRDRTGEPITQSQFFTLIAIRSSVAVTGNFNASTSTIVVTRARLSD